MEYEILFLFVACGALGGFLAGLLGIGGGTITVPILFYSLPYAGVPEDRLMQVAISTSLAVTFLTTISSTWAHHLKKTIVFPVLKYILPGLFLGCILGAGVVPFLPSVYLREFFGVMAIVLGIYFFFPKLPQPHFGAAPGSTLSLFGLAIGAFSSILGIGGGIFTTSILLGYQVPMKSAIGTSCVSTLTTGLIGSVTYFLIAACHPPIPETFYSIEPHAFGIIGLCSIFLAPIGAKFSHILPTILIRRIFSTVLGFTGLAMIFS